MLVELRNSCDTLKWWHHYSLMHHPIAETFISFLRKEWRADKVNRNMNTCEDLGHSKSFQIVHYKTFSFFAWLFVLSYFNDFNAFGFFTSGRFQNSSVPVLNLIIPFGSGFDRFYWDLNFSTGFRGFGSTVLTVLIFWGKMPKYFKIGQFFECYHETNTSVLYPDSWFLTWSIF